MWQSILRGGGENSTLAASDQYYITNMFSLITLVSAFAFGILHITVEKNAVVGVLEMACSMVILLNMFALRLFKNIHVANTVLQLTIMALMMVLLVTGGTRNTGIFWLFVFPIATFFLVGKRQGTVWTAGFFILILLIAAADYMKLIEIPYPLIAIRQLLFSFVVVSFGVYIYQQSREKALRALEESQRDLQEYLDQMPSYNLKVGMDGRILFANKAAKEASGLGEKLLGTKFLDSKTWFSNDASLKQAEAAFYEAITGKLAEYDERIKAASAEGYRMATFNFSLVPIFESEQIKHVLVEARDVTAEREADHTKAEFTAIVTQKLQPSVSAIAEAINKLRQSMPGQKSDGQDENLQQISRHNQHIRTSISNMRLVSGLELGNLPVNPQNVSLPALCQSVIEAIRIVHLKGRTLEITEDYAENLPDVAVDFELMGTILHNLVSNAVKFTPDTGHVNIRISVTEQKLTHGSQGSIQIEVQDNGRGIPADEQKLVFTKFFHAKNTDEQTGGSGQGLYITKKLLDYIGGSISFTSKENAGTIFIVLLPLEGMENH